MAEGRREGRGNWAMARGLRASLRVTGNLEVFVKVVRERDSHFHKIPLAAAVEGGV